MKVGDYVRTKYGHIGKIIDINLGDIQTRYELDNSDEFHYEYKKDIIKSSPNIMDLIEVGDYVNGKKVGFINDSDYYDDIFLSESWDKPFETMIVANYKDIKSIVTKEQFKLIEYEVK